MKKILLIAVCAVCSLTASAQRASSSSSSFFSTEKADQGITFGIRAGLNMANMSASEDGVSASPESRTSFHVGVIADIPLMQSLYIQSGLFFQNKGYKFDDEEKETAKPMYLEIPILASYRYNFSDAIQLQINAGPYFAYGIGGKVKYEYNGRSTEDDFFGSYDDEDCAGYKRFDCGLQFGAGVTFSNHYYLGFAYQLGLTNIKDLPSSYEGDFSVKNRNWMISLGYNF
ncbi:porin family protein [Xylanibacter muris]|uniref:PorT family protein n=1 Tax=Xylanibacter muris TaxID=2736290 RepID=A0ABX2AM02_9BACT|nr:porin family protein [Xylanibacter muris]NPD90971.1 PorT family protein [Xylanibacter muris]